MGASPGSGRSPANAGSSAVASMEYRRTLAYEKVWFSLQRSMRTSVSVSW